MHTFLPEQPDLNWRNPEVVKEMHKVMQFWLDRGVDGFRVDALYHLFKDDKFLNEPQNPIYAGEDRPYNSLLHIYTESQPELILAIAGFCNVLRKYGDRFIMDKIEEFIGLNKLVLRPNEGYVICIKFLIQNNTV